MDEDVEFVKENLTQPPDYDEFANFVAAYPNANEVIKVLKSVMDGARVERGKIGRLNFVKLV